MICPDMDTFYILLRDPELNKPQGKHTNIVNGKIGYIMFENVCNISDWKV